MDDNEDIDYIAGIAVESANICSVEPSDNSRLPKEIFSEMLIDDKPIKFQVDCGSSINILPKEVVGLLYLAQMDGNQSGAEKDNRLLFREQLTLLFPKSKMGEVFSVNQEPN